MSINLDSAQLLTMDPKQLAEQANEAIFKGEIDLLNDVTEAIEQRWAHAISQRQPEKIKEINTCLQNINNQISASGYSTHLPPISKDKLNYWKSILSLSHVLIYHLWPNEIITELQYIELGPQIFRLLCSGDAVHLVNIAKRSNITTHICLNTLNKLYAKGFAYQLRPNFWILTNKGSIAATLLQPSTDPA